jgi:thioredoxin 1
MKKAGYILAGILLLSFSSCTGQTDKTGKQRAENVAPEEQVSQATPVAAFKAPVPITKADFIKLVMDYEKNPKTWVFQGEKPCLIDFYADWCAPCKITSPILDELAQTYAGRINIYKVDIEKEEELAAVFGVQSIPTFLFCPMEGNPTISSGIAKTPKETKDMFVEQIEELLLKEKDASTI